MIEIEDFELNTATIKVFPKLEDVTLTPTTKVQEFNHPNSYGYDKITLESIKLQEKTIEPSKEIQEIIPEESYDGLKKVTVEPISEEYVKPKGTLEVTENGEYDVTTNEKVNVNVGGFEINDASYLFNRGARLDTLDELLSLCKNVVKTDNMFDNCKDLTILDLTNFSTSQVTSMLSMFSNCSNLIEIDISNFDTSNVTSMGSMFSSCSSLIEIDMSSFDTSNVTSMAYMFSSCSSLTKVNMENFNTSKVKMMNSMFYGCKNLTKIDISGFYSDGLDSNGNINLFNNCSNLKTVIINNPKVFKMNNINMFTATPIANGTGYIYVPNDLVETYKTATNWSTYATQIKGISELPEEE